MSICLGRMVAISAKLCYYLPKMVAMDELDLRIVSLLEEDAYQGSEALAQQLNVSSSTVRRRLRKLISRGVVRIVALADPAAMGFPLVAIIVFEVAHEHLESIMNTLGSQPEIRWVSSITGRFDVLIFARFRSTYELSQFMGRKVAGIQGIRRSETFICLQVKKGRYVHM